MTQRLAPLAVVDNDLPQYSLRGILGVWVAAALPMAALSWLFAPWLAHRLSGDARLSRALIIALTAGLVWQGLLVLLLVYREQKSLRWSVLKDALWLRAPIHPKTGRRGGRAWWVLLPLMVGFGGEEILPSVPIPAGHDLSTFFGSDAGQSFMAGNWTWLAIVAALVVFNTVLGEELLFRGVLLPRMKGAFGQRDWAANGVLFAAYHLHMPWVIPATLLDTFFLSYPSRRYRSSLIGIAVHSAQSLVVLGLAVGLVLR